MSDLIERLRVYAKYDCRTDRMREVANEAAAELERLRGENLARGNVIGRIAAHLLGSQNNVPDEDVVVAAAHIGGELLGTRERAERAEAERDSAIRERDAAIRRWTHAEAEPVAYLCPAGCGCTWRDNRDGSMSLFGRNSRSCATCEHLPLSGLIPVYYPPLPTPRITAEQVEQIKRLASLLETRVRAVYVLADDDEDRESLNDDVAETSAALHAALDALVKE